MKEDFTGVEADLYQEIRESSRPGFNHKETTIKAANTLSLFRSVPLEDHKDFFTKATNPNAWEKEKFITPLEHLIFAAVGFDNYTIRGRTLDLNPEPLLYVLEKVSFEPAQLKPIADTIKAALKLLASYSEHTVTFKTIATEGAVESLGKVKSKLEEIYENVTGITFKEFEEISPAELLGKRKIEGYEEPVSLLLTCAQDASDEPEPFLLAFEKNKAQITFDHLVSQANGVSVLWFLAWAASNGGNPEPFLAVSRHFKGQIKLEHLQVKGPSWAYDPDDEPASAFNLLNEAGNEEITMVLRDMLVESAQELAQIQTLVFSSSQSKESPQPDDEVLELSESIDSSESLEPPAKKPRYH